MRSCVRKKPSFSGLLLLATTFAWIVFLNERGIVVVSFTSSNTGTEMIDIRAAATDGSRGDKAATTVVATGGVGSTRTEQEEINGGKRLLPAIQHTARIEDNSEDPAAEKLHPSQLTSSQGKDEIASDPMRSRGGQENISIAKTGNEVEGEGENVDEDEDEWPPLSSLIDDVDDVKNANVIGDVRFLLDFAIIGHPKTATSFVMRWLARHDDEVQMYQREIHSLTYYQPGSFVREMYDLPHGSQYIRGYKAPRDIQDRRVLRFLREYWPSTSIIVGLRHPIQWFESFYNYRTKQGKDIPPANSTLYTHQSRRVGECHKQATVKYMCTDGSLFQNHLSLLGKTNMSTEEELRLIRPRPPAVREKSEKMPGKVFLYEQSQLNDPDESRAAAFRKDVASFLGMKRHQSLNEDFRSSRPPPKADDEEAGPPAMSICDDEHAALRAELMRNAKTASLWIRNYFLASNDVYVSSPDHFRKLLEMWMTDPCDDVDKSSVTIE